MVVRQVKEFDPSNIGMITFQFDSGDIDLIDCIGMMSAETTVRTKTKTCSGATKAEVTYPQYVTVSITAYVGLETYRDLTGMTTEGLKTGVYAYGIESKTPKLTVTARILDDMENVKKMVAFPNASFTKGLSFTVDNDSDEVAKLDLEFKAMMDANGNFYYEADMDEVADATAWEEGFTPELVKGA